MKFVEELSKRLFQDLRERGFDITNENGAKNAIIIAIAEAWSEGLDRGHSGGRVAIIKQLEETLNNLKNQTL